MDSTGADAFGFLPQLAGAQPYNDDGAGGSHIYIPWFGHGQQLDFARGYHVERWGGRTQPSHGFGWDTVLANGKLPDRNGNPRPRGRGGYGLQLKDDYRRLFGTLVGFSARGEMIARHDNYCEIDPELLDRYGMPVLGFNVTWSDQELNQIKHAREVFRELLEAMGAEVLSPMPSKEEGYGVQSPGCIIHEVGTVRIGWSGRTQPCYGFGWDAVFTDGILPVGHSAIRVHGAREGTVGCFMVTQ